MKSKRIILQLILSFVSTNAIAQTNYRYDTCNVYAQYQGEWMYANGNDTIRLYLRPTRLVTPIGDLGTIMVRDDLVGWHEYKQGNTVVESNYANRFMSIPLDYLNLPNGAISIYLNIDRNYDACNTNARRMHGFVQDFGLRKELVKVNSATFSSDLQTLQWIQWRHDFSRNPEAAIMTLPCCFTLIKQ